MIRSLRSNLFGTTKNSARRNPARSSRPLRFEGLESREMFAAGTLPAAPVLSATTASISQINLSWKAVPGASGYWVDELMNGVQRSTVNVGNVTSHAVTGLYDCSLYTFYVCGYNSAGSDGPWSAPRSAYTLVDHPAVDYTDLPKGVSLSYVNVSGPLFGSGGPVFTNIHQGAEGDCWLMASLAAVAARHPAEITSMFTALPSVNENGVNVNVYSVRFYNSAGVANYVVVDAELPEYNSNGSMQQAYDHLNGGPLWAALAEKAYAQANGEGIVTTNHPNTDSYAAMNGGFGQWGLQAITGYGVPVSLNTNNIVAEWNAGDPVTLGSSPNANNQLIVGSPVDGTHCYAMVGGSGSTFELYNPWGVNAGVVNSKTPFVSKNGYTYQVYGGAFDIVASTIMADFAGQSYGRVGTALAAGFTGPGSQEPASSLADGGQPGRGRTDAATVGDEAAPAAAVAQPQSTLAVDDLFAAWGNDADPENAVSPSSSGSTHDATFRDPLEPRCR